MKVALLSFHSFNEVRGGTELFSEHLKAAFPDLTMITYADARKGSMLPRLDRLNLEEPRMGVAISRRFRELLGEEDFDLAICNSTAGWWLSVLRPPVPMINVFHYTMVGLAEQTLRGTSGYLPSRYFSPLFESLAARSKRCVAVSHKVGRELADRYGIRSTVIENGIPLDRFAPLDREEAREALGLENDKVVGLFVGRADITKGFDVVKEVAGSRPEIQMVCVTPSAVERPDMTVRRNVPNEDMPQYYSAADFLLLPSRYESFGYTALEAMACDLPVVASRTGIFEDLEDPRAGRIVDSGSAKDYLTAIDAVLDGSFHPRRVAGERFSMERFVEQYRRVAAEAVGRADPETKKAAATTA